MTMMFFAMTAEEVGIAMLAIERKEGGVSAVCIGMYIGVHARCRAACRVVCLHSILSVPTLRGKDKRRVKETVVVH